MKDDHSGTWDFDVSKAKQDCYFQVGCVQRNGVGRKTTIQKGAFYMLEKHPSHNPGTGVVTT